MEKREEKEVKYDFQLTEKDVNIICNYLVSQPWNIVNDTINKLVVGLDEQKKSLEQSELKEKK